jgi:hypothetical protein
VNRLAAALLGLIVLLGAALVSGPSAAQGQPLRRTILALYDGSLDSDLRFTAIHRIAEMPLNHLGLSLTYHDLREPLPPDAALADVRGVLVWFYGDAMPNPLEFIDWSQRLVDGGRKLVLLGGLGMSNDREGRATPVDAINGLLGRIGLRYGERHVELTHDVTVVARDRALFDFEVQLPRQLPPFDRIVASDPRLRPHLVVREGGDATTDAALVSTHPNGGMVAGEFFYRGDQSTPIKLLYLDPFEYFRRAFATDDLPKPDTTTLVGRRIYYSHIDGDGWRSISQVRDYAARRAMSAEVVMREAIEAFPGLPVTVAPIVADLDPAWFGSEQSQAHARALFALPQVEIGSHTMSHPFDWDFFSDGDQAKEVPLLGRYPRRPGGNDEAAWASPRRNAAVKRDLGEASYSGKVLGSVGSYAAPRAYAVRPFDLDLEIGGSIDYLNRFAPPGKRVVLLQWSGNCLPWEQAVVASYQAGVLNLNGGDTRFDRESPTYTSVAPIGRKLPGAIQIYASNSNENLYTGLWTERFFGFAFLPQTWRNTETPIRVKPKNVYYHMYSGEKTASLRALLSVLKTAEAEPIAPIATSEFARIGLGFYSTRLDLLEAERWRVSDRGSLQTLRFDRALDRRVDFTRSSGVLGQTHFQGSLYVALDPADAAPVVALTAHDRPDRAPDAPRAYLIDSRWPAEGVSFEGGDFAFRAQGYGAGEMSWKVPFPGRYRIVADDGESVRDTLAEAGPDGILTFTLHNSRVAPSQVVVRFLGG